MGIFNGILTQQALEFGHCYEAAYAPDALLWQEEAVLWQEKALPHIVLLPSPYHPQSSPFPPPVPV